MHRFFVPPENIQKDQITISGSDVNHIVNVLRMKVGDEVEVFDSLQHVYLIKIKEFNRAVPTGRQEFIRGSIIEKLKEDTELGAEITLAQCLPKSKKMDLIVQKAVELGVNTIIPVISERSIPKIEEKAEKKIDHWQKIAKEAAEQSGRTRVPTIKSIVSFQELVKTADRYDLAIIPWEGEKEKNLKTALKGLLRDNRVEGASAPSILILIGPEGGFSQDEVKLAKKNGFTAVSLGKRILRCETAAIFSLALTASALET